MTGIESRIPFLCRLGVWHRWPKWGEVDYVSLTFSLSHIWLTPVEKEVAVQWRACIGCNKTQWRRV